MKATRWEFRFRMLLIGAFYFLGFWAPWERYFTAELNTVWLALPSEMARLGWASLEIATEAVTIAAIVLAFLGAGLRVWGTSYLGAGVMTSGSMHAERVLAAGPYRRVRNPLYLGSMIFSLAVAILMPVSGAIFFLAANAVLYLRLIFAEEEYLAERQGEAYLEYKARVPRLLPSVRARVPASGARLRMVQGVLGEIYPVAMAVCFAVLAWKYNAYQLMQALIVCFGASLLVRAGLPKVKSQDQR